MWMSRKWYGLLDGVEADGVGRADDLAALDAAAGHPHGEAQVVVVAAPARFGLGRAAELAAPEDQRAVEQAPALQVLEQAGDGLVGLGGLAEVVLLDVAVGVPLLVARSAAGDHADEADAVLDELPRQQAAPAVIVASAPSPMPYRSSVSRGSRDRSRTSGASVCILKARS